MNIIERVIPKSIISQGVSTYDGEGAELAWHIKQADKILDIVLQSGVIILGGDLYKKEPHRLVPSYDNWSIDINSGESWDDYALRSNKESSSYLSQSRLKGLWFVLVLADKPNAQQLLKSHVR